MSVRRLAHVGLGLGFLVWETLSTLAQENHPINKERDMAVQHLSRQGYKLTKMDGFDWKSQIDREPSRIDIKKGHVLYDCVTVAWPIPGNRPLVDVQVDYYCKVAQ